jgi:hypothetical protein
MKMTTRTRDAVVVGIVVIEVIAFAGTTNTRGEDRKVTSVVWSEVGKSVQIIGQLGYPLGEIVTIQGRWQKPDDAPVRLSSSMARNAKRPLTFAPQFCQFGTGLEPLGGNLPANGIGNTGSAEK